MTTSVDVQGMQLAQEDFQQALDEMNSIYSAMSEEQDNLSANWSGMAATAFGQALGAWVDDLYQIRQELVVITETLATHTGIYSDANETSQQVAAAFQQHGLDGLEALPGASVLGTQTGQLKARRLAVARMEPLETGEHDEEQATPRLAYKSVHLEPGQMVAERRVEGQLLPVQSFAVNRVEVGHLGERIEAGRVEARQAIPEPMAPLLHLADRVEATPLEPLQPLEPLLPLEPRQAIPALPAEPLLPFGVEERRLLGVEQTPPES